MYKLAQLRFNNLHFTQSLGSMSQIPLFPQSNPGDKMTLLDRIRDVFGRELKSMDITAFELSSEERMLEDGVAKQRQFDQDKAQQIMDTWDSAQVTAATVMLKTGPKNPSLENLIFDKLVSQESKGKGIKSQSTLPKMKEVSLLRV